MEVQVSIIVPVFNKAEFLRNTLESIALQQHKNCEFLLVNDKSTDGSLDIMRDFASQDPRFVIVNRVVNGGLSVARNTGLEYATGEFVLFWDADDILRPGAVEGLIEVALRESADVVKGVLLKKKEDRVWVSGRHKRIEPTTGVVSLSERPLILMDISSCSYLLRSSFLRNSGITFFPGLYMQDVLFSVIVYSSTKRIAVTDIKVGEYIQLPHSKAASGLISKARFFSLKHLFVLLDDFIVNDSFGEAIQVKDYIYEAYINTSLNTFYLDAVKKYLSDNKRKDRLVELQILLRKIPEASILKHGILSGNLFVMYELLFLRSGFIDTAVSLRHGMRLPKYGELRNLYNELDFPIDLILSFSHLSVSKGDVVLMERRVEVEKVVSNSYEDMTSAEVHLSLDGLSSKRILYVLAKRFFSRFKV